MPLDWGLGACICALMHQLSFNHLARRAALPAICVLLLIYFGSHALVGQAGVFALDDIRRERAELASQHEELQAQKEALLRQISLLNPEGVDPDYADELVRRELGVVRPDEVVVPLDR